jgi:acetolactate synthase-1/3 small subunit
MRRHIFVAQLEDQPGVLNRVVSLFRRRNFNIDSLTVGRAERPGVSRVTIIFQATDAVARIVEANLYKLVNVLHVEDLTHRSHLTRDLALIKVAVDRQSRSEILHLAEVFRARVVDVGDEALIIEVTGSEEKINKACDVLRPYGVLELVRTGFVAMGRGGPGAAPPAADPAPRARETDHAAAGLAMSV